MDKIKEDKKPDSVVWKEGKGWAASTLTYGTSVGGPPIKLPDLSTNGKRLVDLGHHFQSRLDDLKRQYEQVLRDFELNERLWSAELRLTPRPGEIYHLYNLKGKDFLSIISPDEWGRDMGYVGTYEMNVDGKWTQIIK